MIIIYRSFTETGLKRKTNQDRITAHTNENISLFAVADGIGGHSKGEFASETVIKYLDALWEEIYGFTGDFQTAADMVVSVLEKTNDEVFRYAKSEKIICGSTVSALLIYGEFYAVINAGDSPVYSADRKKAQLESTEHSYDVIARKSTGISDAEIDENHKGRLVRAVGISDKLLPSVKTGRIAGRKVFLICSDGVSRYFTDKKIFCYLKQTVSGKIDLLRLSDILKSRAYHMGAADNLSAVAIYACSDEKYKNIIKAVIAAIVIFFILWAAVNIFILF
ncbi:MAG: protein phosphatase 2C domain-containing protein [Eubacterium sp.]|nr:protein phosphatase 2C domain-containing protein [Eubacterium sp.]